MINNLLLPSSLPKCNKGFDGFSGLIQWHDWFDVLITAYRKTFLVFFRAKKNLWKITPSLFLTLDNWSLHRNASHFLNFFNFQKQKEDFVLIIMPFFDAFGQGDDGSVHAKIQHEIWTLATSKLLIFRHTFSKEIGIIWYVDPPLPFVLSQLMSLNMEKRLR